MATDATDIAAKFADAAVEAVASEAPAAALLHNIISINDTEEADGIELWKLLDKQFHEKGRFVPTQT